MDAPKTPIERTRRRIQTRNPEEIQDTKKHPEEIQNLIEQPLQENAQGIEHIDQTLQGNSQEDTHPTSEHMKEQCLKSYEEEIN
jgi:hypothetical protein